MVYFAWHIIQEYRINSQQFDLNHLSREYLLKYYYNIIYNIKILLLNIFINYIYFYFIFYYLK